MNANWTTKTGNKVELNGEIITINGKAYGASICTGSKKHSKLGANVATYQINGTTRAVKLPTAIANTIEAERKAKVMTAKFAASEREAVLEVTAEKALNAYDEGTGTAAEAIAARDAHLNA